jgi:DNA-binding IclR family transcriptional regulator
MLYATARIGVADELAKGPRTAAEVASTVGAHARSLYRLMRTLAGLGVLTEGEGERFALTPLGELIQMATAAVVLKRRASSGCLAR